MLVRAIQVIDVLTIIICIKYSYHKKPGINIWDFFVLAMEAVILEVVYTMDIDHNFSIVTYLGFFLYMQIQYGNHLKQNLIHLFLCIVIVGIIQLFVSMVLFWLENFLVQDALVLCLAVTCCILVFVIGRFGIFYKISDYFSKDYSIIRIILLVVVFAVFYLSILYKSDEYFRLTDFLFFGLWSILICYLTIQWQKTKVENMAKNRELEVREIYETKYQELLDSVRKRQHDFDNQLNALSGQHLYAKSLEELIERQQEYSSCIRRENRYNKLIVKGAGSPILTGFLFTKSMEAEKRGCTVSYDVSYGTLACELPTYQMIDIAGVLLDNAIEALEQQEGEKLLHFRIKEYEDQIECGVYNVSPYVPVESIHEMVKKEVSMKGAGRGIGLPKVIEMLNEIDVDLYIVNKKMYEKNYLAFEFQIKKHDTLKGTHSSKIHETH